MNLHVFTFLQGIFHTAPIILFSPHIICFGPDYSTCFRHNRGKAMERRCTSLSLPLQFLLLWRQLTNYYRRLQLVKPKACGHTGILKHYKSIKSLSLEHKPHCCEAGHRAGARADSHIGCCPANMHSIPYRSHYWPAVVLIAPFFGQHKQQHEHTSKNTHISPPVYLERSLNTSEDGKRGIQILISAQSMASY